MNGAGTARRPGRHRARWIAAGTAVVAAGLIAVLATRPPAAVTQVESPLVGARAPRLSGTTLDGVPYSLPATPGRFTVVNFFASWCGPCQQEGPGLVAFQAEHRRTADATLVSVVFEDTVPAARAYQATLGATWPTLADPGGSISVAYGVRSPPSTFVIAPDGRVVAFIEGPVTAGGLDDVIARARAADA